MEHNSNYALNFKLICEAVQRNIAEFSEIKGVIMDIDYWILTCKIPPFIESLQRLTREASDMAFQHSVYHDLSIIGAYQAFLALLANVVSTKEAQLYRPIGVV